MKNNMLKKTMVFGIITLFVGTSVVSAINNNVESANVIGEIGELNYGTLIFNPTDDSWIAHYNPNQNSNSINLATQNEYGAGGGSGWAADTLIKFDISSIPPDAVVDYATLKLYFWGWGMNNPAGRDINLYRITNNWEEASVTWNTQPSYAPLLTTFATVPSSTGVWMEWDVTSDVLDFVSGSNVNYGWKLTDENYWGQPNIPQTWWRSKEYGNYIPYLEIEIVENQPPEAPQINGQTSGKAGQSYSYTFVSVDPDDDDIFYQIDWGDGNVDPWDGPYESNEIITKDHIWSEQGDYSIRARAKDVNEEIGDWGTLEVTMPMNQKTHNWWFLQFLQNHPRIFPILRQLLEL